MAGGKYASTSTTVLAPIELSALSTKQPTPSIKSRPSISGVGRSLSEATSERRKSAQADVNETLPSPITATEQVQTWNNPRINLYRIPVSFWSFAIMGLNDASYGAIIPYLETYYHLSYTVISLVFLSPFLGYNIAALLNNSIHLKFGQRGVATLGPLCHVLAYIIIAVHPPYPVLVIAFAIAGLGNGIMDAAWNAWIGAMANANEVLGFLHASYGLGGVVAPLVATSLITKGNLQWYYWYYIMVGHRAERSRDYNSFGNQLTFVVRQIGFAVVELVLSVHAFWGSTGKIFREAHPRTTDAAGSRLKEAVLKLPAARVTWLTAFFLLGYVGTEVALGGWIVTFMIRVRHGARFASGMTATGFWLGITVGRLILGFVTPRIGEKLAIAVCCSSLLSLH